MQAEKQVKEGNYFIPPMHSLVTKVTGEQPEPFYLIYQLSGKEKEPSEITEEDFLLFSSLQLSEKMSDSEMDLLLITSGFKPVPTL